MHSFIIKRQPMTFNSWKEASAIKKENYRKTITEAINLFGASSISTVELYGVVYHFFRKNVNIDADNLSKPVWDSLKGILFEDDKQVKMRTAASFDLSKNDLTFLNLSGFDVGFTANLLEAFDNNDHVVYIECGQMDYSMLKFNLETDAN